MPREGDFRAWEAARLKFLTVLSQQKEGSEFDRDTIEQIFGLDADVILEMAAGKILEKGGKYTVVNNDNPRPKPAQKNLAEAGKEKIIKKERLFSEQEKQKVFGFLVLNKGVKYSLNYINAKSAVSKEKIMPILKNLLGEGKIKTGVGLVGQRSSKKSVVYWYENENSN